MAELAWPSASELDKANSRCKAAVRLEEMMVIKSSTLTVCSAGSWVSMKESKEGTRPCIKMGRSGGFESG